MSEAKSVELREALKYGKPLHRRVADALKARLRMSDKSFNEKHAAMAQNEELFQAYIPEREVDALRRVHREGRGVPAYRTVEIPHSYAVLMTAHTYYTSVFLSRSPILQLAGRHGEAENKRLAIEALLQYQMTVGRALMCHYIWLLDPGKYGYGVIGHFWDEEIIRVRQKMPKPKTFLGIPIPGATPDIVDQIADIPGYVGNRTYNVRPQDFFPDPRVALINFQRGEFCARYTETNWNEIYEGNKTGRYINYSTLRQMRDSKGGVQSNNEITRDEGSSRVTTLPNEPEPEQEVGYDIPLGFIKGHEIYLRLIPSEWNLGKGDRQELWAFNVSLNGIIFGATPVGEMTHEFPFDILVDEVDGYSIAPTSMLERCKPLNDVITWLINTHFYNVRQTLNNQFLVDPSMVVMKDVENPDPGKIIRLKPSAYGKDVRTMMSQLAVGDATRGHIADISVWQDIIQRMTGINDTVMGMVDTGSRRTATEIRHSTSFGINRLKTQCEWFSITGYGPYTQKMVQRTQQRYDTPRQYRIVGDQAMFAPNFAQVTPEDIAGFFDFEPVDGTLPVDRFAQANMWQMLMGQVKDMPQVLMQYDMGKIFAWVANLAGIKNIAQFRLMPDQAVAQQVAAGNVVPIDQARAAVGGSGGGGPLPNPTEPQQIPGMGQTG